MSTKPPLGQRPPVAGPMLIAYDGSLPAQEALRAAAAVLAGRSAIILTVWASVRHGAAASRLALPDTVVAAGVAALDGEARDDALRVAEEGAACAHRGSFRRRDRGRAAGRCGRDDRCGGRGAQRERGRRRFAWPLRRALDSGGQRDLRATACGPAPCPGRA